MVAQEDAPLAAVGDRRGLLEDLRDREAGLAPHRHEDARHHREVEAHVALVAAGLEVAEVVNDVGGPLVRLGQQHATGVVLVDVPAHLPEELVGLGQVLPVGARPLVEVGHRVEPEAVQAHVEPEGQRLEDRVVDLGVVEVEVRLVGEEAVPEVLLTDRVPRPVRGLRVHEDDPGLLVELVAVGPDVEVAVRTLGVGARGLEPRVGVAGVVHDEVDDDLDATLVRLLEEEAEVLDGPDLGEHAGVVGDVVAAVAQRAREERRDPQAVDTEPLEVVELLHQSPEVAGAVGVGVAKGTDEDLVEDRGLEPVRRVLGVALGHRGLLTLRMCAGSWNGSSRT